MQNSNSKLAMVIECLANHKASEAEALCQQVLQDAPENAKAWHLRGIICGQQGDLQQAADCLQRATRYQPDVATYHYNLGLAHRGLGELHQAADCYRTAIQLDSELLEARNNLGYTLIDMGHIDDAIGVFRQFVEKYPDESDPQRHTLAALTGDDIPTRCHDDYVRGVFDSEFAASFDQELGHLQYRGPELMAAALQMIHEIPTGAHVLDAGCGTGLCADILRPIAGHLVGLDLSADMLQEAENRNQYDELIEAELTWHLQSHTESYDVVVCSDTLCYFGRIDEVLRAARSSLRQNGVFIFSVEVRGNAARQGAQPYELKPSGRYGHDESYIRDATANAGFRIDRLVCETLRRESGDPVDGLVVTAITHHPT